MPRNLFENKTAVPFHASPSFPVASLKQRLEELRQIIRRHDEWYYVHNRSKISDAEYDKIFRELQNLEQQFPDLISADSPTQRVGGEPLSPQFQKSITNFRS